MINEVCEFDSNSNLVNDFYSIYLNKSVNICRKDPKYFKSLAVNLSRYLNTCMPIVAYLHMLIRNFLFSRISN